MKDGIQKYLDFLSDCSAENIHQLSEYCDDQVVFRDPFNQVQGAEKFTAIMTESFEKLSDVSFEILETFWSDQGAVVKWYFHFRMKPTGPMEKICGTSEVRANAAGKITVHLDYWDSGERIYARIPIIGFIIRLIRNKVSAGLDNVDLSNG